jgi:hypothetical protein
MAHGRKTGGRTAGTPNKAAAPVKALAQAHGKAAINKLVTLLERGETEQIQLAAAKELLNRGYGRPAQSVTDSDGGAIQLVINQ